LTEALAPNAAETAPTDGRVIRGYFEREGGGAVFAAVRWSAELSDWVDLLGSPLGPSWRLTAWGPD
jgi:hypothetical protein